ncbi:hypothetical protein H8U31_001331 [Salmonella enterica]|nr:hypothetical protein [Salmonella enterica]
MLTLYRNSDNVLSLPLVREGKPLALAPDAKVSANILTKTGRPLLADQPLDASQPGADWAKGLLVWNLTADRVDSLKAVTDVLVLVVHPTGRQLYQARLMEPYEIERSQLFIKDVAVADMRADQLLVASSGAMREVKLTDNYIWQKLRAAESELAHKLRILLTPHQVFPQAPTQDEIDALDGMPWMVETPYDYSPTMNDRDKWGYFITRQRPIISVQRLRFKLPSQDSQYFDIPLDWLKLDQKYGHVRLLPTTNASLVTSSMLGFTALTWQSIIPNMLNLTYQAGLKNAEEDYPELIDAVKKMAVVKIITDLFLPQSGSISADGLSESMSTDISKYQDQIDHIINGHDGNGGLMAMFNGIRTIVM